MNATICQRDLVNAPPADPRLCGKTIKKANGFDWCAECMEIVPIPWPAVEK